MPGLRSLLARRRSSLQTDCEYDHNGFIDENSSTESSTKKIVEFPVEDDIIQSSNESKSKENISSFQMELLSTLKK